MFNQQQANRQVALGCLLITLLALLALFAPRVVTHDPFATDPDNWLQAPSPEHLFGTDRLGRDLFSRVVYGTRVSLAVGVLSAGLSLLLGSLIGAASGYYGGLVDTLLMRLTDVVLVFPTLFLTIALAAILEADLFFVILIIGFTGWPGAARLVRGQFLRLREAEYVQSARLLGSSNRYIVFRHLLPGTLGPLMVAATLSVPAAIMAEAGLGYFGLGARPPLPTWGNMLREAQSYIRLAWWYAAFPGFFIFITVLAFNLLGEGLRGRQRHES
jgi:peptide/nickel transport system permease protein